MGRPLRYLPPDCPLVEVTCRTIHGRMLLRPSPELNRRILGVLARAANRYEVGVCFFIFLSNHFHLLLRPTSAQQLAAFMNYLNSNIAREAGRLHHWREKFWGRRYRPVPVSFEPEAQIARLAYLMAQGCKEGLVACPQDWPGATSVHAVLGDLRVTGVWRDRTGMYWAKKRGEKIAPQQFDSEEALTLCPLPSALCAGMGSQEAKCALGSPSSSLPSRPKLASDCAKLNSARSESGASSARTLTTGRGTAHAPRPRASTPRPGRSEGCSKPATGATAMPTGMRSGLSGSIAHGLTRRADAS